MHSIDADTWSNDENQLIAAIRDFNPQALIFVEDIPGAFEAISAGTLPDLAWPNVVWNFHLYNASITNCTEPTSPRYANWSQNVDPLVSYAQQHGHAAAITEWGGCNDAEPYHTNIVTYARTHSMAIAYFDSSNVLAPSAASFQLTPTGMKVAQAYTAISQTGSAPAITLVANAEGEAPLIAPNTWVEIKGSNLAPAGDTRIWQGSDFFGHQLPAELDGVTVTVNGKSAFVYYISPTQVNILTLPDPIRGPVPVKLTNGGMSSAAVSVLSQAISPAFFVFNGGPYHRRRARQRRLSRAGDFVSRVDDARQTRRDGGSICQWIWRDYDARGKRIDFARRNVECPAGGDDRRPDCSGAIRRPGRGRGIPVQRSGAAHACGRRPAHYRDLQRCQHAGGDAHHRPALSGTGLPAVRQVESRWQA
jgi:hypothetical protein